MERINRSDIDKALAKMGMLQFWPADEGTRAQIGLFLAGMCGSRESLEWLTTQLLNRVGNWPGPLEVRGIYCSRFPPADRQNAYATIGEFSAEANEGRAIGECAQFKGVDGPGRQMLSGMVRKPQEPIPDEEMEAEFQAVLARQREWKESNAKLAIDPKLTAKALEGLKKLGAA